MLGLPAPAMMPLSLSHQSLLVFLLLNVATVFSSGIVARNESVAQPIVFNPDQNWDGIDGPWNSFTLRIGSPAQTVRVMPSWMSYQTWVVAPEGCSMYSDYDACAESRGGLFNLSQSATWDYVGLFLLWIERNLGYNGNAYFGYDTVTLGGLGENGPTVTNTTIGAFAVSQFWLGVLGLNPKGTNWTDYNDPAPSYMTLLKQQNLIPSISFGYTAGALYQSTGVLSSLTLGGYDQSRFETNEVEFSFAPDNTRDIIVAIQSITTNSQDSSEGVELLPTPIWALIDSTVSHLWLPLEACRAFEQEFGLAYDDNTDLYLVNSSLHDSLLARDAAVNFTLGQMVTGGKNVTISLPYSAFDLTAQSPYQGLANSTSYFPLRRAQNDTQYTLGRTFLQEAYVTVDYERAKFNISQCIWPQGNETTIIAIEPPPASNNSGYSGASSGVTEESTDSSSHLSGGAIAGIVVGCVAGVCGLVGVFTWYIRRKKARLSEAEEAETSPSSRDSNGSISRTFIGVGEKGTNVFPKAELEGSTALDDTKTRVRPESSLASPTTRGYSTWSTQADPMSPSVASEAGGLEIFEMAGDMPELAQADGKLLTEKEMMMRREEMYNGRDPSNPATPTQEADRRLVQPGEVVLQSEIRDDTRPEPETAGHSRFSFE